MEPWNGGTVEPWKCGTMELWNHGTVEPWNYGTMEPWNCRNYGTVEPWNCRNYGTMELWNYGTVEPSNCTIIILYFIAESAIFVSLISSTNPKRCQSTKLKSAKSIAKSDGTSLSSTLVSYNYTCTCNTILNHHKYYIIL